ncbi:MAG: dihydrolipoyl dehydrogenase family protein [Chloroflexia bacterium]
MAENYDLVIVGAGSGGLTAAQFGTALGAKVALVEKARVGGDCTWTGCVPSKALIKVAWVAHEARTAGRYGVRTSDPTVDMAAVRDYVQGAVAEVYQQETPESLRASGIDLILAPGRFVDPQTLAAGGRTLCARAFLLCTGARPKPPDLTGLADVPYMTYENIFDNDRLPHHLLVVGGGPVGLEIAQAYRRLGAGVTVVAERLLPREEPEVAEALDRVFESEGLRHLRGRAEAVRLDGDRIELAAGSEQLRGDMLLVAAGRAPVVDGLGLDEAGVSYSASGIGVDEHLLTNVKGIYAAGDCTGGYQYTHFAGWQAYKAARNALFPGASSGWSDAVPAVTFTAPEISHVGLLEAEARSKFGDSVQVARWDMAHTDRAVCDDERDGFYKAVYKKDGTLLGATIMAPHAGEAITECVLALERGWKLAELAAVIHAYPTYSTPVQLMASRVAIAEQLSGLAGKVIRGLADRAK